MSGPLISLPEGIRLFPDPGEVFATDVEGHAALLFPILSIELSLIEPAWTGAIHLVLFNYDPYNTGTVPAFTTYCKDNSLGFDIVDGKYRFQAGFAFFDRQPEWDPWFERTRDGFTATRDRFRATGRLAGDPEREVPFLDQFGGTPEWVQHDETPLDPDGRPMRFIAKVSSWNYADDSCGRVLFLFYGHTHRMAVIVDQCD